MIHIPKNHIAELISHALETDPNECCGFLIGNEDRTALVRRTRNVLGNSESRFEMDEREVKSVLEECAGAGLSPIGVYHSHTYTQGYPSNTDVKIAIDKGWSGYYQVVISLAEKTRPVVRAFTISAAGAVDEVFIKSD